METKKFTLKTKQGAWRMLLLMTVIMLLLSWTGSIISNGFYKIQCSDITIDVRGYDRTFEIWRPVNVDNNTKLPCVILCHGGSESMACTSLYAWEFARRGYVVLNESMDGAAMSGQGNMDEAGNTYGSYTRAGTAGHLDVLNYARSITYVDPTRIGLWGHSQGNGTMGTALRLDGDYLTLNDRCLNVLHDRFGVEITEEQLLENADDIAKAELDDQQYGEYLVCKEEQADIVSKYVKVARCASANSPVTVAGIETTRNAQVNMMPSVGSHESSGTWYGLPSLARYSGSLGVEGEPVINGIYAIPDKGLDPEGQGTYLGDIFSINVNNTPALAEAIENRNASFLNIPQTQHNGWLWSPRALTTSLEWFTQCLGYNNGELSDPTTQPISCKNVAVGYTTLVVNTLALFAMLGWLVCIAAVLVKSEYFAVCASEPAPGRMPLKSKDMAIWVIVTAIVGFCGAYFCSQEQLAFSMSIATMTFFMPWEPAQIRILFSLVGTAVAGVLLFIVLKKLTKKKEGDEPVLASVGELNIKCGWERALKSILMGVIIFTFAYLSACFVNRFFDTRFMHVDGAYEVMTGYNFGRLFKYFIMFAPFCLVVSTLNNMVTIKGVSETADTIINIVVTSLGMVIFMIIAFSVTYATPGSAQIWSLNSMLSMIFIIPFCNYLYRRMYKITGSAWAGAMVVALILAWRAAGYISHRFMWVGNNEIAQFFGVKPF